GAASLAGGAESRHTTLSRTGQAIGGVLAAAAKAETPQTAALGRTPVVAAASLDAASIAQGLQQAVGKSGLFYESHVAEWAQGARALADLNAEPQQQAAREGQRPLPTDPATAQFINLQLATQEQAHLSWQGNLWPGQPMQLEVRREVDEEQEGQGEGEEAAARAWHSRLRLTFPGLGDVDARLTLVGGALQLRVSASEDSAALLRHNQPSLAGALDAAGTPLAAFEVRSTGEPDKGKP
ncbi:flagellar hook-length control protein FliK, partial [Massilia agri]